MVYTILTQGKLNGIYYFILYCKIKKQRNEIYKISHACRSFSSVCISRFPLLAGFPIVGEAWGGAPPPILQFFFEPPPPHQNRCPHGAHPSLKYEAPPSEKQLPPLKREAPFHEMIPRKSIINKSPMLPICIDLSPPHQILKSPPPPSHPSCSQHLWEILYWWGWGESKTAFSAIVIAPAPFLF